MPHEGCGEVLRNPCAFTLGDEPLAGGVEHGGLQFRMEAAEVGTASQPCPPSAAETACQSLATQYPATAQGYHVAAPPAQLPWTSAVSPHWA